MPPTKEESAELREILTKISTILGKTDRVSKDLWAILTALRGPDNEDMVLKDKTTARIRGAILALTGKPARTTYFTTLEWSSSAEIKRNLSYGHFSNHIRLAVDALVENHIVDNLVTIRGFDLPDSYILQSGDIVSFVEDPNIGAEERVIEPGAGAGMTLKEYRNKTRRGFVVTKIVTTDVQVKPHEIDPSSTPKHMEAPDDYVIEENDIIAWTTTVHNTNKVTWHEEIAKNMASGLWVGKTIGEMRMKLGRPDSFYLISQHVPDDYRLKLGDEVQYKSGYATNPFRREKVGHTWDGQLFSHLKKQWPSLILVKKA